MKYKFLKDTYLECLEFHFERPSQDDGVLREIFIVKCHLVEIKRQVMLYSKLHVL